MCGDGSSSFPPCFKCFWPFDPPFRGDAQRALPQGASPIIWENHTPVHTRLLRLTHRASGSEIWNAPITKTLRRLAKVRDAPVHAVLSSANLSGKIDEPARGSLEQGLSIIYAAIYFCMFT
eukprot:1139508-Pelagomonas_calceolata.AAC.6